MSHPDIKSDYFALTAGTEVNILPNETPANSPVIYGNVYGGGELGCVKQNTKVYLLGGTVHNDAYGGGKGIKADVGGVAADVGGDATIELNGKTDGSGNITRVANNARGCVVKRVFGANDQNGTPRGHVLVHVHATQHANKTDISDKYDKFVDVTKMTNAQHDTYLKGLATTFGVSLPTEYEAAIADETWADETGSNETEKKANLQLKKDRAFYELRSAIADKKYDVLAVYGGGDLALYQPYGPQKNNTEADYKATTEKAEVIIDGCELTSIRQVYGGGNAASTPANLLNVYGTHEIDELFGGGNGRDPYIKTGGSEYYGNPGANVGYYNFMEYVTDKDDVATNGAGEAGNPYVPHNKSDAGTPEYRQANYAYGTGIAETNVIGGRIHTVFGGSNERGNIREMALSVFETSTECPVTVDKSYGAGKNAEIDGEVRVSMECVDYIETQYGGADNADLHSNVNLTITNGHFGNVFGGNNTSGNIHGSITVNVKEQGCKPIVIENLYGGGYLASYSVYGYNSDRSPRTKEQFETAYNTALTDVDKTDENAVKDALLRAGLYGLPKEHPQINIISATKIGNVFGGGFQANVIGNPHVNVNMEEGFVAAKFVDEKPTDFSAGEHTLMDKGVATSYKYFVNRLEAEAGSTNGKAILAIGTIGNIYGGGEQAEIDGDTHVEIGTGTHHEKVNGTEVLVPLSPYRDVATVMNNVFGGGLGVNATVKGNTNIIMGKGASVYNRMYGGGSLGSVGTVKTRASLPDGHPSHAECLGGKPKSYEENTGKCTINVTGGYVGPFTVTNTAGVAQVITPKSMTMPEDHGYIFGASQGRLEDPANDVDIEMEAYVNNTEVTVENGYVAGHEDEEGYITRPLIAGGVYGGSENGRVLNDTYVYIKGGQIGIGKGMTAAYAEDKFIDPTTTLVTESNALAECDAWPYGQASEAERFHPYDINAGKANADPHGRSVGDDGHTFYGNVFGGGSGYFAYKKNDDSGYEWLSSAGLVEGNTHVEISGGHILTNVYGGNEMSDVTGTCYVTMTGGTIGVPRTLSQIAAHPVTCYLFGAGKGDTRVIFNKSTNVGHTDVNISGGRIYGSVFGGGEDGHVMGNVNMAIKPGAKIGTWGTSYVEGNVFGGGRGLIGDAYTAGNVAGSITLNISGGEMLGSVYGGGRLGSVGYGLYAPTEAGYGKMRNDDKMDDGSTPPEGWFPNGRGHIEVNISGGTIGNKHEFKYIAPEVTGADLTTATTYMPNTILESDNRLSHTTGGNVFAGAMGRRLKLGSTTEAISYTGINWWQLGNVKSTKLTISGDDTWIMGNVYGGGEFGAVTGNHETANATKPGTEYRYRDYRGGRTGKAHSGSSCRCNPQYGEVHLR